MNNTYCLSCLEALKEERTYRNVFRIYSNHGDKTAVEFKLAGEIKKVSYGDMEFVCEYCADHIMTALAGKEKGFVCLKLANCPEWFAIFWGILLAGYRPFLIDARHDKALTEYFIAQSGAIAIICNDGNTYEGVVNITASDVILLDKKTMLEVAANADKTSLTPAERINSYPWGDEVALCTSGTTSTAKIFVYNDYAICNQIDSARAELEVNSFICDDRDKRNLCFLPLNHIFGFMANYLWYGFFGTSMVMPDRMAPSVLMQTCRDHKVTHILAVPLLINNLAKGLRQKIEKESKFKQFMFNRMLDLGIFCQHINSAWGIKVSKALFKKSVLSQMAGTDIQCIISGGGHILPDALRLVNGIGYYTICGFGMTEVGISSMERRLPARYRLAGGVGVPIPSIEYKIIPFDEENPNIGELVLRGSSIHSAMLKDGKHCPAAIDEDGWFRTGDIGSIDKAGALTIVGRLKDVIINESGENVYPDELEDAFLDISGVKQFTVLGVKKPDNPLYEDITFVGQLSQQDLNDPDKVEEIRKSLAARNATLPVYKKLQCAMLTADELPLSNGIKIRRAVLKKQIESGVGTYVKIEKLKG